MSFIKNSTCKLIKEIPIVEKWYNKPCMVHTSAVHCKYSQTQTDNNERYHVENLGWDHIGYMFSIELDGRIYYSEPTAYKQYHCSDGGQNHKSFGICLIGDGTKEYPTSEQMVSLKKIIDKYKCTEIRLHRDFNLKKGCPGNFVIETIKKIDDFNHLLKRYAT